MHKVKLQFGPILCTRNFRQLSLLERLPSPVDKLLNVDREVDVITDPVPAQLLMLPHQVVSHVAQQQHAPLMKSPLGHLSTESFIASFCITAQQVQLLLAPIATNVCGKLLGAVLCRLKMTCKQTGDLVLNLLSLKARDTI